MGLTQQNWEISDRHLWHPYTQMKTAPAPLPIVRAKGAMLYTADGREILDGVSSWWVNIHGHSHPYLNEALAQQANELEHVMFAGFTHRPAVELAERLAGVLPHGLERIFYSDNGSTAVEVAMKMALQYWSNLGEPKRTQFIALKHAYHGDTVGAMSASSPSLFTAPFSPFLFSVLRAPVDLSEDSETRSLLCLQAMENLLKSQGDTIAGVLIEPMLQGAGGMIVWPSSFVRGVRELCNRYGVLFIADEVLTGFGRTGAMFACNHAGVSPDIICLSKGLTAGYMPMGVTACTGSIYEAFLSDDRRKTFFHGHSFTANPLACAVALASLDLFSREGTLDRVKRIEAKFQTELPRFAAMDRVADARTIGGVFILDLQEEAGGGYLDANGPKLAREFLRRGLLLRPLGNVLYFMPPYCVSDEQVAWAFAKMEEVLTEWVA
ncbi:adenosylmethionine--8-amino-7-oxononanoate transaminase [Silvibacterium acidisoli]|uniref:adenosylmethionine--8-amino-7-oxononanoate transaminase n=1 Tax=Acidobacteriaceae bacterium ZG23-2 TaxID=2883246 RepID=UPI00406C8FF8